jgi:hypothetical protein
MEPSRLPFLVGAAPVLLLGSAAAPQIVQR